MGREEFQKKPPRTIKALFPIEDSSIEQTIKFIKLTNRSFLTNERNLVETTNGGFYTFLNRSFEEYLHEGNHTSLQRDTFINGAMFVYLIMSTQSITQIPKFTDNDARADVSSIFEDGITGDWDTFMQNRLEKLAVTGSDGKGSDSNLGVKLLFEADELPIDSRPAFISGATIAYFSLRKKFLQEQEEAIEREFMRISGRENYRATEEGIAGLETDLDLERTFQLLSHVDPDEPLEANERTTTDLIERLEHFLGKNET